MAGRSLAAPSKWFVRASSIMKTTGSLALIASDISIIICIVLCPTSSHRSFVIKNGIGSLHLVGTPRAHTHKTTQNITWLSIAPTPIYLTVSFIGQRRKKKTLFEFADGLILLSRGKRGVLGKGEHKRHTTTYPTGHIQNK